MPPTTVSSLTAYADELLELANAALADTVGGSIDRAALSAGTPAFDCEQITVEVLSIADAALSTQSPLGGGSRHIGGAVTLIGFRITVARDCIRIIDEDGDPPTVEEMHEDSEKVHQDVMAIWSRVRTLMNQGELFGGRCRKLFFDGARALPIEGNFAGWTIDFRVNIPGYLNDAS